MRKEPEATYYKNGVSVKYHNRRIAVSELADNTMFIQFITPFSKGQFAKSKQVRKNLQVGELRISKLTARMLLGILLDMAKDGKLSEPIYQSNEDSENG